MNPKKLKSTNHLQDGFDFQDFVLKGKDYPLQDRIKYFSKFVDNTRSINQHNYLREIVSSTDREVYVTDRLSGKISKMLMFGSNNYLGLAKHPFVIEKVKKTLRKYGAGIGGPPLLNGYTKLVRELEECLSALKHQEDTLIFSSGYNANLGLISGLLGNHEALIYDEYSHASFYDGIALAKVPSFRFQHNNTDHLELLLTNIGRNQGSGKVVGVEGVYSMDGDLAPLDLIVPICKKHNALLIIDDAHGTGVMGRNGTGTPEHFGVSNGIDISMGTFSKTFSVTGGFISSSKPIINYLRYFARAYMFSASLPPIILAAVLAGLEVIRDEPERRLMLHENVKYVRERLSRYNMIGTPLAGIISLLAPTEMNIRKAASDFHEAGIFLNAIEYPAVPQNLQRFRISIMATHTKEDLNRLIETVEKIWSKYV